MNSSWADACMNYLSDLEALCHSIICLLTLKLQHICVNYFDLNDMISIFVIEIS